LGQLGLGPKQEHCTKNETAGVGTFRMGTEGRGALRGKMEWRLEDLGGTGENSTRGGKKEKGCRRGLGGG